MAGRRSEPTVRATPRRPHASRPPGTGGPSEPTGSAAAVTALLLSPVSLLTGLLLVRRTGVGLLPARLSAAVALTRRACVAESSLGTAPVATTRPVLTRLTAEPPGRLRTTTAVVATAVVATRRGRSAEASLGAATPVATTLVATSVATSVATLVTETTAGPALAGLRTVVAATG
jgi:hypothetical protein